MENKKEKINSDILCCNECALLNPMQPCEACPNNPNQGEKNDRFVRDRINCGTIKYGDLYAD